MGSPWEPRPVTRHVPRLRLRSSAALVKAGLATPARVASEVETGGSKDEPGSPEPGSRSNQTAEHG